MSNQPNTPSFLYTKKPHWSHVVVPICLICRREEEEEDSSAWGRPPWGMSSTSTAVPTTTSSSRIIIIITPPCSIGYSTQCSDDNKIIKNVNKVTMRSMLGLGAFDQVFFVSAWHHNSTQIHGNVSKVTMRSILRRPIFCVSVTSSLLLWPSSQIHGDSWTGVKLPHFQSEHV